MSLNFNPDDLDYVDHEYRINTNINRRIDVFVNQSMPALFQTTTTFYGKVFNLKFIFKTMDKLLNSPQATIIITRTTNRKFMKVLNDIIFKPVTGHYDENIERMMKDYFSMKQLPIGKIKL